MNQLLEAALRYAAAGWHVFPIKPGQKVPLTTHGVKDATIDTKRIRGWWTKWPDANVAVACGQISGVYVVDIDMDKEKGINGYGSITECLEPTVVQYTPRGGCHEFYRSDEPIGNKVNFLPGVDIRGNGGYVLLAPSRRTDGARYAWSPGREPWNMRPAEYPEFLRPPVQPVPEPARPPVPTQPGLPGWTCDNAKRASLYLAQCDPAVQGQAGHDKLFWACGCMTWGYELSADRAYDILAREYNPRCVPPWDLSTRKDEKDFRRKVTQSIQNPPDKPRGWLLHEDGYEPVPITVSREDIRQLIRGNNPPQPCPDEFSVSHEIGDKMLGEFKRGAKESQVIYTSTPSETLNPFVEMTTNDQPQPTQENWVNYTLIRDNQPTTGELIHKMQASDFKFLTQPTGLLGEICSWINATALKPQPYLTLGCVLAFLGVLFGRKVKDVYGSRTNLYCMSVAQSSAGKNHAMKKIRELCMAANCVNLLGGSNLASDAAIESRMSREPATLFLLDEIGHLLTHIKSGISQHQGQIISLLMQLYSAASDVFLGREYADAGNQRTIVQPCCCIYGVSSPDKFAEGLSPSELDDGWLSRCLVFYELSEPRKRRGLSVSTPPPPKVVELIHAWAKRKNITPTDGKTVSQFVVESAGNFKEAPPEQIMVPTDADAEQRLIAFDDMAELKAKEEPKLSKLWAKAEENVRRIALILACSDNYDSPVITIANADRASRLVQKIITDFGKYVAPEIVAGRTEAEKRMLLNFVNKYGKTGCLKRDITRGTRWANGRHRNDLLGDLCESQEIICLPTESDKTVRYWTAEHAPPQIDKDTDE